MHRISITLYWGAGRERWKGRGEERGEGTHVNVPRQIGPRPLHALDARLATEYTLRADLQRHARHLHPTSAPISTLTLTGAGEGEGERTSDAKADN